MGVSKTDFGVTRDGRKASLYTIINKNGMEAVVSDFGAILVKLIVPNKDGEKADVVLGFDHLEQYEENPNFFGSTVGRSANRIGGAAFQIDGVTYHLTANENENNLHSDFYHGFHKVLWNADMKDGENAVVFSYNSPDGENGFPGNLKISVTYTLKNDNSLQISYDGISDKKTIINMTNHSYFNLAGHESGSIEGQELRIFAEAYTPVHDSQAIPTGEIAAVEGTPMDFRTAKPIGRDINADFEQMVFVGGYDHNFVLSDKAGEKKKMAEAYCEESGIVLEAFTDCCGMQFYAGNFITDQIGKNGVKYGKRHGFCLESQYYPNAVNQPEFPSPLLKAGQKYDTKTSYKFYVR